MRSELGKISLDSVFSERDTLNQNIVASIQGAAQYWGLEVLRWVCGSQLLPELCATGAAQKSWHGVRLRQHLILLAPTSTPSPSACLIA